MKRLLSSFLILCLLLSCTPGAVAAESTSYAEYYTTSYESYISSMNGWLWIDYLKNDNQFGFVQFSNKMEESTLIQKAISITIELMDGIHLNDIEWSGNAEIAFYEDAILGLLVTMESELSSELDKQSEADATMTLMDYAVDGEQAVVNFVGALTGGEAAANIFMPLLNGLTGSEALIQGAMKNLESDAQYKALARSAHLYCDFEKVLSAILIKSDNEALKTAAQNVLDGINQSFTYKLENISSYTGDTAIPQLGSFVFDDVLARSIESGDITGKSAAMVNLFRGVNAFNAGTGIGAFIGNAVVGGHDIFLRYFEMLAMAEIRECLIEDISQRAFSVTGPEDYNEIREIQSYLYALLYTCQRGEYCMYGLLAKDYTGIARFIFGGKTKNVDEWYESTSKVIKTAYDRIAEFTPEIELNVVESITFSSYYGELGTIGATITGYDGNKNVIWEYNTPEYQETELPRVSEIGQIDSMYLFVQDRSIIALDVQTGNTIWENSDFGGSGTGVAFGPNAIYLCGQYGPDFYAISYAGETLARIDSFDENYYWATEIEVVGAQAAVYLHGGNVKDYNSPQIFYVDLSTYEFTTNPASNSTTEETDMIALLENISVLLNTYFENYNWNDDDILYGSAWDGSLLNDTEAIFDIRVQTKSAEWTHQANVLVGTVTINIEKLDGYIEWNGGSKVYIDISNLL